MSDQCHNYEVNEYWNHPLQDEALTTFHLAVNRNIFAVSFKDWEDMALIKDLYRNDEIRDC